MYMYLHTMHKQCSHYVSIVLLFVIASLVITESTLHVYIILPLTQTNTACSRMCTRARVLNVVQVMMMQCNKGMYCKRAVTQDGELEASKGISVLSHYLISFYSLFTHMCTDTYDTMHRTKGYSRQ